VLGVLYANNLLQHLKCVSDVQCMLISISVKRPQGLYSQPCKLLFNPGGKVSRDFEATTAQMAMNV